MDKCILFDLNFKYPFNHCVKAMLVLMLLQVAAAADVSTCARIRGGIPAYSIASYIEGTANATTKKSASHKQLMHLTLMIFLR